MSLQGLLHICEINDTYIFILHSEKWCCFSFQTVVTDILLNKILNKITPNKNAVCQVHNTKNSNVASYTMKKVHIKKEPKKTNFS